MTFISFLVPADSPTNIQSSIINATSVYLSWSPPLIPYGYIISYTILVEESLTGGNVTTIVAFGNSFTVINLVPFTYYNFSIAASTRIGVGPYDTVITRTPEASEFYIVCVYNCHVSSEERVIFSCRVYLL